MELRDNGVYTFPDGREFVVRVAQEGGYMLHDPRLGVTSAPVYWVNGAGQILFWGKRTPWVAEELRDTGRMSLPELQRLRLV
jgi:hypothetical protein